MEKINGLAMNAAYFINKLRRKQAIIRLKRELSEAIEKRDQASEEMRRQIRQAIEKAMSYDE